MKKHIAKCGYRCDLCPAFKPELTWADKLEIQRIFKKYYNFELPLDSIKPCAGCQSSDMPVDKECPVFPCVMAKGIENCAYCDEFGCDKLKQRMDAVEEVAHRQGSVPVAEYEKYLKPFLSRQTLMEIREKLEK